MKKIMFSPSVLDSDFTKMRATVKMFEKAKIEFIHFDVMDGNFVPNLTFGPKFIKPIRPLTKIKFDTHLMINNPEKYIENFAAAGSDYITFHLEAVKDPFAAIHLIKSFGKKAGISIKPSTPANKIYKLIGELDLILVMSVEPGFGGQKFMPDSLIKLKDFREIIDKNHYKCILAIDGGINTETAPLAAGAGADLLIAGSAIFGAKNPAKAIQRLRNAVKGC